jgi:hypothetical protein
VQHQVGPPIATRLVNCGQHGLGAKTTEYLAFDNHRNFSARECGEAGPQRIQLIFGRVSPDQESMTGCPHSRLKLGRHHDRHVVVSTLQRLEDGKEWVEVASPRRRRDQNTHAGQLNDVS